MRELLTFAAKNRTLSKCLVFEMAFNEFQTLTPALLKIVDGLGVLGCRFSLDHCPSDLEKIKPLLGPYIAFIKIHSESLMQITSSQGSLSRFLRTKRQLQANGISLIATQIENERNLKKLFDLDLSFGQGYLFGRPDVQGAFPPFAHTKNYARREGYKEVVG